MDGVGAECRQTDRHIFGSLWSRRAVAYPLTAARDHGLSGVDIQSVALGFHAQTAAQHQSELIELRLLARFAPSRRTVHVRDTDAAVTRIDMPDVFFNKLVAGYRDLCRIGDQTGHRSVSGRDQLLSRLERPRPFAPEIREIRR